MDTREFSDQAHPSTFLFDYEPRNISSLTRVAPAENVEMVEDEEEAEDELLVNPNHVKKKLTIADLDAPRELSRRERYVPPIFLHF